MGLVLGRAGDDERPVLAADGACPGGATRLSSPFGPGDGHVAAVDRHVDARRDGDGQASDARHVVRPTRRNARTSPPSWRLAACCAGHDPLAGADDDDAEAAEHARDVRLARVDPQAGLADPLEAGDDRDLAVDVLEGDAQDWPSGRPGSSLTSAMKPSSLRMRAISRLVREAGTTTSVCRARDALRMRVSMSAIGSEMFIGALPARLGDARQLAEQRTLAEADAAQREPAHEGARSAAHGAAVIAAHLELRCPGSPLRSAISWPSDSSPRLRGEGHAEEFEKRLDSSSVFAVVTMLISSPRRRSTLS